MAAEGHEPVVVNTGPLLALHACNRLELLRSLHSRVVIPSEVILELERGSIGTPLQSAASRPAWFEEIPLRDPIPPLLTAQLDGGEASVIALALELGIRRVLMDDRRGRLVARVMGLQVTGTIGVLLRAKRAGLIPTIRPCLDSMQ